MRFKIEDLPVTLSTLFHYPKSPDIWVKSWCVRCFVSFASSAVGYHIWRDNFTGKGNVDYFVVKTRPLRCVYPSGKEISFFCYWRAHAGIFFYVTPPHSTKKEKITLRNWVTRMEQIRSITNRLWNKRKLDEKQTELNNVTNTLDSIRGNQTNKYLHYIFIQRVYTAHKLCKTASYEFIKLPTSYYQKRKS